MTSYCFIEVVAESSLTNEIKTVIVCQIDLR
jgi:hypothetical protein